MRTLLILSLLALPTVVVAQTPRERLLQGNAFFQAGQYTEALEQYRAAGETPETALEAEVLHNQAAALFKLGQIDDARELWVRARGLRDTKFEASASYNLGNCDYADAQKALQEGEGAQALKMLLKAREAYQDALRLDPTRADARANLELASALITQIDENDQPESQPGGDQQESPESQPQSQPSSQESGDSEDSSQEQGDEGESQGDPSSEGDSQGEADESEAQADASGEAEDESSEQGEPSQEGEPDESQNQSQAAQSQPAQSQPAAESQPSEGQSAEEVSLSDMTQEEAGRLLQLIRDAEKKRRARLRALERGRHQPVDKDW